MITQIQRKHTTFIHKVFSAFLVVTFIFSSLILPQRAQAQGVLNLPAPGTMVTLSPAFNPAIVTGIKIYPDNPLQIDFIIDIGDDQLQGEALKKESQKLINYFMATLTVPEDEMWVNLSPYEKDRIIAEGLSHTEMGKDMLVQDYLLKQLTASLMYPEDDFGKKFWNRVYAKAQAEYGTTEIPMNTFNKIWIVPDEAVVYVHDTNVFVVENHLKVMLEEDYLALESNAGSTSHGLGNITKDDIEIVSGVSAEIIREVLLPEIEKEVNEGKNFANLRQMYNSMLLATWYKKNLKESLLGQVYADKNMINGIELDDKEMKQKIYDRYVEAFEKGVYNYIKEDIDSATKEVIPRKYFSGGLSDYSSTPVTETGTVSSPIADELGKGEYAIARVNGNMLRNGRGGASSPMAKNDSDLKEWEAIKLQTYKMDLEVLSDAQLIELIGHVAGYPLKYRNTFPGLNEYSELRGTQSENNPSVKTVPVIESDWKLLNETLRMFEQFLDSLNVEFAYDEKSKNLILPEGHEGEAKGKLRSEFVQAAQAYVDFISKGDEDAENADAFLVLGNSNLDAFMNFIEIWKKLQSRGREVPIVIAGGRGRGTLPLIENVIKKYGKEIDGGELGYLEEAKKDDSKTTEADILEFLFKKEGIPGRVLQKESKPSTSTAENVINSKDALKRAVDGVANPKISIVTFPPLLMRSKATAEKQWEGSSPVRSSTEEAIDQNALANTGGIDFNPNNINLNEQGDKIQINFSASALQSLNPESIIGILPVIINISPLPSIMPLLGLAPQKEKDYLEVSSLN